MGICNATSDESLRRFEQESKIGIRRMYMMEPQILKVLSEADRKDKSAAQIDFYNTNGVNFEQKILICTYAGILEQPEAKIKEYMGLVA